MSSSVAAAAFILTKEHRRFAEFCDACRRYRYIGLCYGPPGVKTLSARHFANWDKVAAYEPSKLSSPVTLDEVVGSNTVFYTPSVANSPGQIQRDIGRLRSNLRMFL